MRHGCDLKELVSGNWFTDCFALFFNGLMSGAEISPTRL